MSSSVKIEGTTVQQGLTLGRSRQVTALARKAFSYQKRQWFNNICCILLCPFVMVFIAGFLGNLILTLLQNSSPVSEFVYCSNVPAMNALNIPYWNGSDPRLPVTSSAGYPGATLTNVTHANFALVTGDLSVNGPPGAAASQFTRPCVKWFGEAYPFSALYEQNPLVSGPYVRDSANLAQPLGGWLAAVNNYTLFDELSLNLFEGQQMRSASLVGYDSSIASALVGSLPKQAAVSEASVLAATSAAAFTAGSASTTGILGTLANKYFALLSVSATTFLPTIAGLQPSPWFNATGSNSDNAIDDAISAALQNVIIAIAKIPKDGILGTNYTATNLVYLQVAEILKDLPYGGVFFSAINHAAKKYAYNLHYGSDIRVAAASNFPTPGQRSLYEVTQLSNGILRSGNASLASAQITQGFRILPQIGTTKLNLQFGSIIGNILYPFGVSFLLPIFTIILVQEKELRIQVMMQMNGMKSWSYYLSHYFTMLFLFGLSSIVFVLTGVYEKLTFFTLTSPGVIVVLFFLWGNNQIALAFLFSNMFNKSQTALIFVFILVLCSVITTLALEQIFIDSYEPVIIYLWAPFSFYRALAICNTASFDPTKIPIVFKDLYSGSNELAGCVGMSIITIFLYFGLSYYLEQILPSEFGVKKPWYFPFHYIIRAFNKDFGKISDDVVEVNESEVQFEDQDVRDERARVIEDHKFNDSEYTLVMKNMRKSYAGRGGQGPKLAVKDVTLAVEKGITFGLLGPNGAGKSTLISILTGLYEATSGTATLAGFNIKTQTDQVYKSIGICPQFDILWEDLTVAEHLYFYARLKGVTAKDEKKAVTAALEEVSLTAFANRLTKGLSGGERRRVSIAIALLGNPRVVFLDEPTTGLDPEVRRLIWNIINEARREGRTVILTTHSMEEAEALCQRIGIMALGTLRCLADQSRLKELYGNGFKVYCNSLERDTPGVSAFLEGILPPGWKKVDNFATQISYEFPAAKGAIAKIFNVLEREKVSKGILDFGVSQTTLEEVFIRLISEADSAAAY